MIAVLVLLFTLACPLHQAQQLAPVTTTTIEAPVTFGGNPPVACSPISEESHLTTPGSTPTLAPPCSPAPATSGTPVHYRPRHHGHKR